MKFTKLSCVLALVALLVVPSTVLAEATPKATRIIDAGTACASTGSVQVGPLALKDIAISGAIDGIFAMDVSAVSPTGDADVKIELFVKSELEGTPGPVAFYTVNPDGSILDRSVVIDSTLTRFSREGTFYIVIDLPVAEEVYVKVSGVNSNPADTVIGVDLVRK